MRKILVLLGAVALFGIIFLGIKFLGIKPGEAKTKLVSSNQRILLKMYGPPDYVFKTGFGGSFWCTMKWKNPPVSQNFGIPPRGGCPRLKSMRLGYYKIGKEHFYLPFLPPQNNKKTGVGK